MSAHHGPWHVCRNCGHRSAAEQIRRDLYLGSRALGDYQAARRGRLGRRLARRAVTRSLLRALWR